MVYPKVSKAMDEVHRWREEIYNETKNMKLEEKLDYFHKTSERICAEFGLKRLQIQRTK